MFKKLGCFIKRVKIGDCVFIGNSYIKANRKPSQTSQFQRCLIILNLVDLEIIFNFRCQKQLGFFTFDLEVAEFKSYGVSNVFFLLWIHCVFDMKRFVDLSPQKYPTNKHLLLDIHFELLHQYYGWKGQCIFFLFIYLTKNLL